jgi:hypothetical protein
MAQTSKSKNSGKKEIKIVKKANINLFTHRSVTDRQADDRQAPVSARL